VVAAQIALYKSKKVVTLFQWMVTSAGSIYIGQAIFNIINFLWCISIADPNGEQGIAIFAGICLPIITGISAVVAANLCKSGDHGVCCKKSPRCRNLCRRFTAIFTGFIHFLGFHAGYLVGPLTLMMMAITPGRLADKVIKFLGTKNEVDVNEIDQDDENKKEANIEL